VSGRVAALALALVGAAQAGAADPPAPVAVRAWVEPDTGTVGTRFRYTLEVTAPPEVEIVLSQPAERLGDFDVVDFGIEPAATRDGHTVLTRWYTLVGFSPGHRLLPSPPVHYRLPGEALREAPGRETRISIESLLAAEEASDIRDVEGPEPVPADLRPLWALGGAVAALIALAALLHRLLNRPKRARPAPPPRPAHEVAAEALERLRSRRLAERGAFEEHYVALSGIVRAYLEERFGLRAPEMTTEEFLLASARVGVLEGRHRTLLADFLAESDLVKFARHRPTVADSERAWAAGRRFVDETAASEGRRAAG
jgi:hypothetical protein